MCITIPQVSPVGYQEFESVPKASSAQYSTHRDVKFDPGALEFQNKPTDKGIGYEHRLASRVSKVESNLVKNRIGQKEYEVQRVSSTSGGGSGGSRGGTCSGITPRGSPSSSKEAWSSVPEQGPDQAGDPTIPTLGDGLGDAADVSARIPSLEEQEQVSSRPTSPSSRADASLLESLVGGISAGVGGVAEGISAGISGATEAIGLGGVVVGRGMGGASSTGSDPESQRRAAAFLRLRAELRESLHIPPRLRLVADILERARASVAAHGVCLGGGSCGSAGQTRTSAPPGGQDGQNGGQDRWQEQDESDEAVARRLQQEFDNEARENLAARSNKSPEQSPSTLQQSPPTFARDGDQLKMSPASLQRLVTSSEHLALNLSQAEARETELMAMLDKYEQRSHALAKRLAQTSEDLCAHKAVLDKNNINLVTGEKRKHVTIESISQFGKMVHYVTLFDCLNEYNETTVCVSPEDSARFSLR